MKIRAFIAIDVPLQLKEKLKSVQESIIKKCPLDCKWVKPENMHITLKFLGYILEEKIGLLKTALEKSAKLPPFTIKINSFGFFPSSNNIRVFFAQSTNPPSELLRLSRSIEDNMFSVGFKKEERFHCHITLGRFKSRKNTSCLIKEIEKIKLDYQIPVKEIVLYKSTLTRLGSIYEIIFRSTLTD